MLSQSYVCKHPQFYVLAYYYDIAMLTLKVQANM